MKFSEAWLREWVNPKINREKLCDTLTMAGLEVEELARVAAEFSGIVIGEVIQTEKHPEADKLTLCEVNVGAKKNLRIVCGANNVKAGMKVPVAMIGAILPNKKTIVPTKIRGADSEGMLCSATELGLAEESDGLFELAQDAPLGKDLNDYLQLDDCTIDLSITPNRGDCLSIKGVAREVSALTKTELKNIAHPPIMPTINDVFTVEIVDKNACPHYVGRIIRNVKADVQTPLYMKERLRRSGIRSISPVVDVTNYVMLELGQPMHAFDLNTLVKGIKVRQSKQGEKIALLDGSEKELNAETLVIADHEKPVAIAGVMGGLDSSVTLLTKDIFLESAFFSPPVVAQQRQYYSLSSDSAYRFERGVDPTIQNEAIERATQLILEIAGGKAGPLIEEISKESLPKLQTIALPTKKIAQVLGITIDDKTIGKILDLLKFSYQHEEDMWIVRVPPYRFDMTVPEDVIEEIARLYGYDNIPTHVIRAELQANANQESARDLQGLRQVLTNQDFQQVISYSFVDKELQAQLDPHETARELLNPITADMTVMRTNLWPGLMNVLRYNKSRQQHRIRLFEIGTCFITRDGKLLQIPRLGGLISGLAANEQWGMQGREVDFYDLKGHIQNILSASFPRDEITFKPESHPALHPGQSASAYFGDKKIGHFGAIHPVVAQNLDITGRIFLFEMDLGLLKDKPIPSMTEISKFPEIRRDIALLVNQAIPAKDIQDTIKRTAGDWLKDVFIFDVYQGKGITPGLKSIALALILQHPTRTLVDDEVAGLIERVITSLKGQLGAELRS